MGHHARRPPAPPPPCDTDLVIHKWTGMPTPQLASADVNNMRVAVVGLAASWKENSPCFRRRARLRSAKGVEHEHEAPGRCGVLGKSACIAKQPPSCQTELSDAGSKKSP